VIDIDWFKRINDEHGHAVGDAVLTEVAHTMDGSIRADIDVMTRFGGEEFVVVLPETDAVGSFVAAEKIRELVADSRFESDGASIQVTVSVGVAACPADAVDATTLLEAADAALYRAKTGGRNRTVMASEQPARSKSPGSWNRPGGEGSSSPSSKALRQRPSMGGRSGGESSPQAAASAATREARRRDRTHTSIPVE